MLLSIVDNTDLNDDWSNHCRSIKTELLGISVFPKPYEDCNDAYLIYQILKKQNPL